ncbi:unannotated protein [freshwater metagenome]|uniref:Unannotated protein n=1 Tax=freshwater metagenome TaxID=449393 RepID=A0A6J6V7M6_9ZZZZ|nr:EAL domain-containing protein [Actinomycetota bacterium]
MPERDNVTGLARLGLKPKLGQIALALLTILGILGFLGSSILGARQNQVANQSVLGESHEAGSLAFSQRESFNVCLAFVQWTDGSLSTRDLQIARALLGQRLQVQTQSGRSTYSLLPVDYRNGLTAFDAYLLLARDVPIKQRQKLALAAQPAFEFFLTHTRQMSSELALVSQQDMALVIKNRARAATYLSIIFLFTVFIGLLLAIWLSLDIIRGFRRSRKLLQEEENKLLQTRQELEVARILDEVQNQILSAELENLSDKELIDYLSSLLSDYQWTLAQSKIDEIKALHQSRRRLAEEYSYRTSHDHLTGLLNRTGFIGAIEAHSPNPELPISAGIFIDVDRFQRFNDALGYANGDKILRQIAKEVSMQSRRNEFVARLESDEFILFGSYPTVDDARERALELQAAIEFTQIHKSIEMQITVSIGLVLVKDSTLEAQTLLHEGAIASQLASRQDRSGFALFSKDQSDQLTTALSEEFALRRALSNNEFVLHYQPVIRVSDGKIVGAEALIRWERPGVGLLMPMQFLPGIRQAHLSIELGYWVLDRALQMRKSAEVLIQHHELDEFGLGLNIEAESLLRSDFANNVRQAFSRTAVSPRDIFIEISEDSLASGDIVLDNLKQLREFGIKISLDDFGVGYSNVIQAQAFPLDVLKIDKAFFPTSGFTERNEQLVGDVVRMAKTLGVETVAEGVETEEANSFVFKSGIDYVQGFYYSAAMPELEFWNWVRGRNAQRSSQ